MLLGHRLVGKGAEKVVVLHDWFSDSSSYESVLPYLDHGRYTYALVDLRGYGKSKELKGQYNCDEAANDVLHLADHIGWKKFHLVGHSMTGMIGQRIMVDATDRVRSFIAICPVPASGLPAPDEVKAFMADAARSNDDAAMQVIGMMTSQRHGAEFAHFKVNKWRECAVAEARVAYMHMFSDTNFADEVKGLATPTLVISSEFDNEGFREMPMRETYLAWLKNSKLEIIGNAGHYPMQETPVRLASVMTQFWRSL